VWVCVCVCVCVCVYVCVCVCVRNMQARTIHAGKVREEGVLEGTDVTVLDPLFALFVRPPSASSSLSCLGFRFRV